MPVYTVHAPVGSNADLATTDKISFVRDGFHFWAVVFERDLAGLAPAVAGAARLDFADGCRRRWPRRSRARPWHDPDGGRGAGAAAGI